MKDILTVLVILTVSLIVTDAEEFGTNYKGTSYLVRFQKQNWHRAFQICKQKGMELVTVNSEEKFKNVLHVIGLSGHKEPSDVYWTSGTDLGNENNFFWTSNGESFDFELWHNGQPDNAGKIENCVELRNWNNIYKFNDNNCDARQYFICTGVDVDVHCQFNA